MVTQLDQSEKFIMSGEIILMSGIFTEILGSKGIIKVKKLSE